MSKGAEVHKEMFFECISLFFVHRNLNLSEKQQFGDGLRE